MTDALHTTNLSSHAAWTRAAAERQRHAAARAGADAAACALRRVDLGDLVMQCFGVGGARDNSMSSKRTWRVV